MIKSRGVTRGRAGVLVPTLGFYKNMVLGGAKPQNSHDSTFCYPTLNPNNAPDWDFVIFPVAYFLRGISRYTTLSE